MGSRHSVIGIFGTKIELFLVDLCVSSAIRMKKKQLLLPIRFSCRGKGNVAFKID